MHLSSLKLRFFRNYRAVQLEIPPGVVVFLGANGRGKTNLIEAFYYLLKGESFRPVQGDSLRSDFLPPGADTHLEISIWKNQLRHDLSAIIQSGRSRTLQWNGKRVGSTQLWKEFPVVLFSPESLSAIKGGPEERRQLIDEVVGSANSSHLKVLKEFKRALLTRNRILRMMREDEVASKEGTLMLDSLEASYLPLAAEVAWLRLEAIRSIEQEFQLSAHALLERRAVDISVEYLISAQSARTWTRSDLLSAMHQRSLELRVAEVDSGTSLVGPHKHDVRFLFAGKDSRFFCSQGQQRSLILSFKMAQILYHYRAHQVYPFLLLDDVLSELDPARRSNLIEFLKGIPSQIFITTTDLSFSMNFGDRRLHLYQVEQGQVLKTESPEALRGDTRAREPEGL
ncbi:MAG: DNA replication and repair protein RecF [Bdellovibrionales bacterium]